MPGGFQLDGNLALTSLASRACPRPEHCSDVPTDLGPINIFSNLASAFTLNLRVDPYATRKRLMVIEAA